MKMYSVEAKCGHVGKGNYVIKEFAVVAGSGKEAATIVRNIPRVKHHHKDAIRRVECIDRERYIDIRERNHRDPYFTCSSIQEQRLFCELEVYEENTEKDLHREDSVSKRYYGKVLVRNPKKYMRFYNTYERYAV